MTGIDEDRLAEAAALLREAIVWDNIFPLEPPFGNDWDKLGVLVDNGWTAVSLTVSGDRDTAAQAFRNVASARAKILANPEWRLLLTAGDVESAKREGRLAVGLHFQGTRCFDRETDYVEPFFALGVRHALIAFNNANSAGGGCAEADGGLTLYGKRLVREMERVGMLVDLSHTGRRTSMDVLSMATRPVIISHSNAAAVAAHWRNAPDDMIRACAQTGGLIGLSGSSGYLGDPEASTATLFRHADHMVDVAGVEHVGLGFDLVFDAPALNAWLRTRPDEWVEAGDPNWPGFRYMEPSQTVELAAVMLEHGYTPQDVVGIYGGNYLRIARTLWS